MVGPVRTLADLSADWLTAILHAPVTSFNATRIGTGQVSECYRVELVYASASTATAAAANAPKTVVLKIAASDPTSRQSGVALGLYEREVRFYTDIAPELGEESPLAHCYYAAFEQDFFAIVLADAAPAGVGDDVHGATLAQARAAIEGLGKLHGPLLRGEGVLQRAPWLQQPSQINQGTLTQLFMGYVERYQSRLSEAHLAVMRQLVGCFDLNTARMQKETLINGLIHGDYRLDNILFGQSGAEISVKIVDWQTVSYGSPLCDVAYFLGCSLTIEMRRAHAEELIQLYHAALGPNASLSLEECKRGVREQSFFGIIMGIVSPMLVERTERGDTMFMTMMERHCSQALDLDAMALLPEAETPKPLKPKSEDEQPHPKTDDPLWNESWYFDMTDEKQGLGAYVRLGLTPNQKGSWYTTVITLPQKGCVTVVDYQTPHIDDGLVLKTEKIDATQEVLDPLKQHYVTCRGQGKYYEDPATILQGESGEPADVELDLIWHTDGEPYLWRLTPRYEIPCYVTGSIRVQGQQFQVDRVVGQRDHSWGVRDWWGADWMWCAFHLEDGTRIHGADLRIHGKPRFSVGYIQGPNQACTELTACLSDEKMSENGLPVSADLTIKSAAGDNFEMEITPEGHGPLRLVADDGRISRFTRAWARAKTNEGRVGVGWIEWNHNHKQLS